MKKFEKPQSQNPRNLTVRQHIHSRYSISKFAEQNESVQVRLLKNSEVIDVKPNNNIFCANRVWDQKTEAVFMKQIEDEYHQELDNIIRLKTVSNHKAISDYFLLWKLRFLFNKDPEPDAQVNGLSGSGLTKDQEEILEKKGAMFHREGVLPSRFVNGFTILRQFDHDRPFMDDWKWGALVARKGEFIVSDCFKNYALFPIAPNILLNPANPDSIVDENSVREANRTAISESTDYYCCRDFNYAPV